MSLKTVCFSTGVWSNPTHSGAAFAAADTEDGRRGAEGDARGFRSTLLADGAAVDSARAAVASFAGDGAVQYSQRAAADGGVELQLAVPVVRGLERRENCVG